MNERPRIGITMRLEQETRRFYLGRDYCEAIEAAGCTPVHIALIPKREFVDDLTRELDGVLLPGSDSDVDPALYGEEPHPKLGHVVPEKDETDRLVLDAAERLSLPVLAICYGMQALNVHRGGSLIQDVYSQIENCLKHEQGTPRDRNSHSLSVEKESVLGRFGSVAERVRVNSHHHQAVGRVGRNLKATAWTTDGVIECLEDTRPDHAVLAVQWHPELSWKTDALSGEIFQWFAASCRTKQARAA